MVEANLGNINSVGWLQIFDSFHPSVQASTSSTVVKHLLSKKKGWGSNPAAGTSKEICDCS
jgi:hypothetical protein